MNKFFKGKTDLYSFIGRSMIEMLGVLAIIGVLSIGGLYAYRQARNKQEQNVYLNWLAQLQMTLAEIALMDVLNTTQTSAFWDSYLCRLNIDVCSVSPTRWDIRNVKGRCDKYIYLYLNNMKPYLCDAFVEAPIWKLDGMKVNYADASSLYYTAVNNKLSTQQKIDLHKECKDVSHLEIRWCVD